MHRMTGSGKQNRESGLPKHWGFGWLLQAGQTSADFQLKQSSWKHWGQNHCFFLEEKLLGNNFQVCPAICELWLLDFVVTVEAAHRVFQRAYSAKPSLALGSIFQQDPSSGGSTAAHSYHEWNEQFCWRLHAEQADLGLLLGQCGCVCLGILLSIPSTTGLSWYLKCFPAYITKNTVPEADCTSLVCLSDAKGNLWNMIFLWDRPSGWAC